MFAGLKLSEAKIGSLTFTSGWLFQLSNNCPGLLNVHYWHTRTILLLRFEWLLEHHLEIRAAWVELGEAHQLPAIFAQLIQFVNIQGTFFDAIFPLHGTTTFP